MLAQVGTSKLVHRKRSTQRGQGERTLMPWPVPSQKDKSNLASEDNGDNFSPGVMNPLREKRQERYDDEVLQQGPLSKSLFSPQASSPSIIKSKSHTLSALQASACSYPQHSHCLKCLPKLDPCCQVLQPILRQEEPRPHS